MTYLDEILMCVGCFAGGYTSCRIWHDESILPKPWLVLAHWLGWAVFGVGLFLALISGPEAQGATVQPLGMQREVEIVYCEDSGEPLRNFAPAGKTYRCHWHQGESLKLPPSERDRRYNERVCDYYRWIYTPAVDR